MKPFFITLPHFSTKVPPELKGRLNPKANLSPINEPGIEKIFDWPEIHRVLASTQQCFPNLNRQRNNLDPNNNHPYPDNRSLFPLFDFEGCPLYSPKKEPTKDEKELMLKKYYDPFFSEIDQLIKSNKFSFFIDVHSMNNETTSYDNPLKRPEICLGNRGNEKAEKRPERPGTTFKPEQLRRLQKELQEQGYDCHANNPFSGGYIIQKYGPSFPCLQIEINKKLFMTADDGELIPEKIKKLDQNLFKSIKTILS